VEAIRRGRHGKVYLCEETAERLLSQAVGGNQSPQKSPTDALSNRELEVFRLIGEGLSTGQLVERLHISRHTVDTHRQRIKEKLGLASASELARAAMKWVLQG
jgi:DNA-binding NarL/FixJ family response regulator